MTYDEMILDDGFDALGFGAEVFFRRLLCAVDDFGRHDARPRVLASRLYPLRPDVVTPADVAGWLLECEGAGLMVRYEVGGKPYLQLAGMPPPREKSSAVPAPPDGADAAASKRGEVGYVYFIYDVANKVVKIGSSLSPVARLRELQVGNPVGLIMAYYCEGGRAEEKRLHAVFDEHRMRGEWFAVRESLADYLAERGFTI